MLGRFQANRSTKAKVVSSSSSKTSTFKYNGINRLTTRSYTPERKVPVTIAYGDGIGPEITAATVKILEQAGAQVSFEPIEIGEKLYLGGHKSGIAPSAWDSIRKSRVFLKAPITTPIGGGYKSLNVTIRKTLGLYANVRPCKSLHPFVATKHPVLDMVIVRENEEDLYAGIEHMQTDQVVQCLKLISRPGCERIISYAFEYARRNGRKKVSVFVKDNIMKMTDGLFAQIFEEIGARYPDIQRDRWIVDIGAARLADTPEIFDVVVMENLYGDILSDVAAQISGSVGLGGSINVGDGGAMFEAIHGSAPDLAGKNVANPSGMLLSSVMMLEHIGQVEQAQLIHNAWLKTIEDGVHTADIFRKGGASKTLVSTTEFTSAVIARLGQKPVKLQGMDHTRKLAEAVQKGGSLSHWVPPLSVRPPMKKEIVGVDIFLHWNPSKGSASVLGEALQKLNADGMELTLITNRGVKVWPDGFPETFCTDHWRCRFKLQKGEEKTLSHTQIISLLLRIANAGFDFIKMENLYLLDGKPGFSLGQGE
jgi:isocitrate dehydrogenase